jgi:hypothetical protein
MVGERIVLGFSVYVIIMVGTAHAAGTAGGCAAAKQLAAGKNAAGKLSCHAKATKKVVTVDAACLARVDEEFTSIFEKTEAKG